LPPSAGVTGADGRVRFDLVPPGAFTMIGTATRDGVESSFVVRDVAQAGGAARELKVTLSDEWSIGGIARDGDRPLADWIVSLEDEDGRAHVAPSRAT